MLASLKRKCVARRLGVAVLSTIALLASAVAFPVIAIGNEWDPQWEVTVGRSADAVATDASGDVYVTGTVRSADGSWRSMVIVKYAADGEELWRRTWLAHVEGFPFSVGRDVAVSSDGESVYVAGAELDDSTENARATVWTYSAEGALLWRRAMWRSSSYIAEGIGAGPAGPVVGVMNRSEYPILRDGRVVAFDPDGTRSWTAPFEFPGIRRRAGDAVFDVEIDVFGRVFVVGTVERSYVSIDEWWDGQWADADVAVQRFDPDGRLVWSKLLSDPGAKDRDGGLAIDAVGSAVMVAGLDGGSRQGNGRAWVVRLTFGGRVVWSTHAGARPSVASDIALTPWGDVQLVGEIGVAPRRLFVRAYALDGELASRRHQDGAAASGVAASDEPALYVVGGRTLWRLPVG